MTSRPDKRTMEHAKASGIVRDNVAGTSFIPATQVKNRVEFWRFSIKSDILMFSVLTELGEKQEP